MSVSVIHNSQSDARLSKTVSDQEAVEISPSNSLERLCDSLAYPSSASSALDNL